MAMDGAGQETIELPRPRLEGELTLETVLARRRSLRDFAPRPLTLVQAAQLLWAGQGITADWGGRGAPSAGALYPLELYLAAGAVAELPPGLYHFRSRSNELVQQTVGDLRAELAVTALGQAWVAEAAAIVVVTAAEQRTAVKYGRRASRYVQLEAGHAAPNVLLQAVALGLGGTPVGAFEDERLHCLLALSPDLRPLYLLPIGHPA